MNSTEISDGQPVPQRPDPNISLIPSIQECPSSQPLQELVPEQPLQEHVSRQPLQEQASGQPLQESVSGQSSQGSTTTTGSDSTGISCSLCGISVRGQAYLTQHVNKKRCLDRQRKNREQRQQLEALVSSTASAPSPTPSRSLTASQSLTKQNICDICFEQFDSTGSLALHHMKCHM